MERTRDNREHRQLKIARGARGCLALVACLSAATSLAAHPLPAPAPVDCIHEAAQCFQINPLIIQAIIWQESGGVQAASRQNTNASRDVGLMQINSIHFAALSAMGITEPELRENSCINIFSGSYLLQQIISKQGYSWDGIGHYHSQTPVFHDRYLTKLLRSVRNEMRKIEALRMPDPQVHNVKSRFRDYCVTR